jgi:CHAT domain-containing protein
LVSISLNNLAALYLSQGRYAEAEPLSKRSLALREKALRPDHPDIGQSLSILAELYLVQRDWVRATDFWRRSTALTVRRAQNGLANGDPQLSAKGKSEVDQIGDRFYGLVKVLSRLGIEQGNNHPALTAEAFATAQWAQGSQAAASLAQMAARGAAANSVLAAIVRERQDLVVEWQWRDGARTAAVSHPPERRDRQSEAANVARLNEIDTRVAAIDKRLAIGFPDFAALATPEPLTVEQVQADLRPEEALVQFLDTPKWGPTPEETFVWVVTKTEARWVRSELGTPALTREVAALRCGLDATAWYGNRAKRCGELLKLEPDKVPSPDIPLPFDHARAHALYTALFGEVADLIKGKHLLLVPSGPLTQLPFQVLVTAMDVGRSEGDPSRPKSDTAGSTTEAVGLRPAASLRPTDYRSIRWLARDHALTVLPAVSSLKALRRVGKPSAAQLPMIGFGNPLLDGNQGHPVFGEYYKQLAALARASQICPETPWQRFAGLQTGQRGVAPITTRSGLVDLAHLKAQLPLPETAEELCDVAADLKVDAKDIRLGARASEREIKRLSAATDATRLANYRIVHFATHGTLAGQLSGTTEPGLILTPPDVATEEDDGYLSMGEIAGLKLDADWVILSACNTAGGADTKEAQALSGLARAFFYAGARALLVSHWEVDSDATVKLITSAVGAMARDKTVGRAEALRRAMLAMIDNANKTGGQPHEAHPANWAPFVVVGEGAAAR